MTGKFASNHSTQWSSKRALASALLFVVACAGPGDKLELLDARISDDPNDIEALRGRVELLASWRGGPDDRLETAAQDAQWLGGQLLVPSYEGRHRWFLTDDERANVVEAIALLKRSLEWDRTGEHRAYTLAKLVEANALLAEDQRNRSSPPTANVYDQHSLDWAQRLSESFPDDAYGPYGVGMAYLRHGDARLAVEAFTRCEKLCDPDLPNERDLRFKSRVRRAEAYGMLGLLDERVALLEGAFAQVAAESAFAVSAAYRAAGDQRSARNVLQELLADAEWAKEPRLLLELACLAALEGSDAEARELLAKCMAISHFDLDSTEGANLLAYSALWRWMLTGSDSANIELAEIVALAPVADWERALLAFSSWETLPVSARNAAPSNEQDPGTEAWLLEEAQKELNRRVEANVDPDDLRAEAWFYLGWKRRRLGRTDAADAFQHCLELADPFEVKWEFDFARRFLGRTDAAVPLED